MKQFLLLYNGPPTSPQASHEGWPERVDKIGDALVDLGSPMVNGFVLHRDGSTSDKTSSVTGFSIVQAEDRSQVLDLIADHPLVLLGSEYTIEVFELPRK